MSMHPTEGNPLSKYEKLERELNLRQLQIRSLLAITQAINDNVSAHGLFNMYKSFLSWDMGVKKMALLIKDEDQWELGTSVNVDYPVNKPDLIEALLEHKRVYRPGSDEEDPILKEFDVVIPVYHKETPLAFTLIGGFEDQSDVYSKVQFITTITNIIAVAIENKRLFKQEIEQERLKKSLELAEEVQHMLIPEQLPIKPAFELDSIYRPHYNVGGDYFDYFYFNEDSFAFCIGDISGKGVAAALLMANFQAILRSRVDSDIALDRLVSELNGSVYKITRSDKFISFFIARVNLKARTLQYVNAGHCPPVIFQMGRTKLLTKGCPILGAVENLNEIDLEEIKIADDCTVVSYTDGLTELKNEKGDFFDEDHLKVFIYTHNHLSSVQFNKALIKRLERFRGTPSFPDDIAVLTCKIYAKERDVLPERDRTYNFVMETKK